MFKSSIVLVFLCLLTGHAQQKEEMLLGTISVSELQKAPYSEWFSEGYSSYEVKENSIEKLETLLQKVNIKIFMGTWCEDSQQEVPRFFKIMDSLEFPTEKIHLMTVDREKTSPDALEKGFNIVRVPTFIFEKDGEELGRIVEYPIASLEADMVQILSGEQYKHAYAN